MDKCNTLKLFKSVIISVSFPNNFTISWTVMTVIIDYYFFFRKTQNESAEEEQELSEVFMKTLNYTSRFSKFKNRETISAIRRCYTFANRSSNTWMRWHGEYITMSMIRIYCLRFYKLPKIDQKQPFQVAGFIESQVSIKMCNCILNNVHVQIIGH